MSASWGRQTPARPARLAQSTSNAPMGCAGSLYEAQAEDDEEEESAAEMQRRKERAAKRAERAKKKAEAQEAAGTRDTADAGLSSPVSVST